MPTAAIRITAFPHWARLGLLAVCYFAAAQASLAFAIPPGYATAIWPPSGIALAALLLWGWRAWPGVWLGAAITNYAVDLSMAAALGIATGNTLEGVCAAWLVNRWTSPHAEFRQPEEVFRFAAAAAIAGAVAATLGMASLFAAGRVEAEQLAGNWYTWWQGDFSGILLVTPCILAWSRGSDAARSRAGTVERVVFSALLLGALLALFNGSADAPDTAPLVFLVIPFFVWAACRFSERAVALTVLAANGWAVWSTADGQGPFLSESLNRDLLTLQAFTSTGALVALVLWALLRRRADELHELRAARDELERGLWSRVRSLREALAASNESLALAQSRAAPQPGAAPSVVAELGLPEALRARGAHFEIRSGISVEVSSGEAARQIEPVAALALFRIAEDALDNVSRHARARRVAIELDYEDGLATLTVRDDGEGFAPDWQARGGEGVRRIRERAAGVGGRVWIESSPGGGAVLRVTARG